MLHLDLYIYFNIKARINCLKVCIKCNYRYCSKSAWKYVPMLL